MISPLTRNVRIDRYGNDGSAVRQMTLALANHRYNPHTTCRVSLIALKKTNLSSDRPGIGKSQVCVCGTRRSRFRKRGACHNQRRPKLTLSAVIRSVYGTWRWLDCEDCQYPNLLRSQGGASSSRSDG